MAEHGLAVQGQHVVLQGREDWLKRRHPVIGGTDAAKIIGVSKWGTPMDVYLEKTNKLQPDVGVEQAQWRASRLRCRLRRRRC